DGVFGIAASARAHDTVARLVTRRLGAAFNHLARPFEADRRADSTVAAVGDAARGGKIGAIERGSPHLHQHLVGLWSRLRYVAQRQSVFSRNGSLHLVLRRLIRRAPGRTLGLGPGRGLSGRSRPLVGTALSDKS